VATLRLGESDRNYTLGNRLNLSGWLNAKHFGWVEFDRPGGAIQRRDKRGGRRLKSAAGFSISRPGHQSGSIWRTRSVCPLRRQIDPIQRPVGRHGPCLGGFAATLPVVVQRAPAQRNLAFQTGFELYFLRSSAKVSCARQSHLYLILAKDDG